jgi:transcriptional regulator
VIYVPGHARVDESVAWKLMAEHPFATLISVAEGEPHVTLMPVVVDADLRLLRGHLAAANPHRKLIDGGTPMTVIFHGPHAYITPKWYGHAAVPTWNYLMVEAVGTPTPADPATSLAIVRELTDGYQGDDAAFRAEDQEQERILPGIIAFTMPIERLTAKAKVSRNRTMEEREGVIRGLKERAHADDLSLAAWMERLSRESKI